MKRILKANIIFFTALAILYAITGCTKEKSRLPVLVIASSDNFGTYTAEILKAEGFNEFLIESPDSKNLNSKYFGQFDLVILAEVKTGKNLNNLIEEYVRSGGKLIAFKPDSSLSEIFGIEKSDETISEGYIRINPGCDQSTGLTTKAMQFHGVADIYKLNGATTIASLFINKTDNHNFPAVVDNNYGKGRATAFLYNLPKSIVYTRQGNPLSAGIEKDGIVGLRGMDLFTDGWIDTTLNTINQADQQMSLLTNCIQNLSMNSMPLPRFWYFPDNLKCLAVLDNDGEDNKEADFEQQLNDVDSKGAKMTIYIKDVEKISKAWADTWTAKGFEISGHPDDTREAGNPGWHTMDSAIAIQNMKIESKFGLPVRTNVNHWFVWCGNDENGEQDFGAQARLEEKNGIEMDANYALYDINSNQPKNYLGTPGINQGNYIGSGLVMKYADIKGNTVNVYQRYNAVYDQQYNEGSTKEEFFNCFKGLVDRSLNNEIYSVVSIKSHNNEYYFSKEPLMKMLDYANSKGIPVWTALNLLDFLKMKDEAAFTNISWVNDRLSFTLNSSLTHTSGLTCMIPEIYNEKKISKITKDGEETRFSTQRVKGVNYAFVTVKGGMNYEITVDYR